MSQKKDKGQFYTVNCDYILKDLNVNTDAKRIIEPFAGNGDLIDWIHRQDIKLPIEAYDIDPKKDYMILRDTLLNPPNYEDSFIITNPPFLARNKCKDKMIYDKYDTNDLFKCFILSIVEQQNKCNGGILIIPVGFFLSPRDVDSYCRDLFLSNFKITKVRYFEETVFSDTSTTVVAFSFEKSTELLVEQDIEWIRLPSDESKIFRISKEYNWIIGGDIYNIEHSKSIDIKRYVKDHTLDKSLYITSLTLRALDSGTSDGRIGLIYEKGYKYEGKNTSRSYATLCINKKLSEREQQSIAEKFNEYIEEQRIKSWSLFLPQYRESKEYARKRIPFNLAYLIVKHLITKHL